jgi:hypothetical protein
VRPARLRARRSPVGMARSRLASLGLARRPWLASTLGIIASKGCAPDWRSSRSGARIGASGTVPKIYRFAFFWAESSLLKICMHPATRVRGSVAVGHVLFHVCNSISVMRRFLDGVSGSCDDCAL